MTSPIAWFRYLFGRPKPFVLPDIPGFGIDDLSQKSKGWARIYGADAMITRGEFDAALAHLRSGPLPPGEAHKRHEIALDAGADPRAAAVWAVAAMDEAGQSPANSPAIPPPRRRM